MGVENSQDAATVMATMKGMGLSCCSAATAMAMGNMRTAAALLVMVAVKTEVRI